MKRFLFTLTCLLVAFTILLSLTVSGSAENIIIDPVSGQPIDTRAMSQKVYLEHFDKLFSKYEKELSNQEVFCSTIVFDGIANIDYETEKGIPSRERIWNATTLEDLRGLLTGFFDHSDAAYTTDEPVMTKLRAIFEACGLNMDDYYYSVERNRPVLDDPFDPREISWTCSFLHKDKEVGIDPNDITILLYRDEMTVGRFIMDPWDTPDYDDEEEEE